eukprot:1114173-Amphidinium_carterae.1
MQHGLGSLWELARLSTRPGTHLVQAVLRQVAPPRCTLPVLQHHSLRPVYRPRVQKRPRVAPPTMGSDTTARQDLAMQLVSLSVSWAPDAGMAKGLKSDIALQMLTQNSAA